MEMSNYIAFAEPWYSAIFPPETKVSYIQPQQLCRSKFWAREIVVAHVFRDCK